MSSGRIELYNLLSSNPTPIFSVYYWVSLLNVFERYQNSLDIDDVRRLVAECERCRRMFNEKNANDPIRKEDTRPNIYVHLELLEAKEKKKYNKESLPTTQLVAVAQ